MNKPSWAHLQRTSKGFIVRHSHGQVIRGIEPQPTEELALAQLQKLRSAIDEGVRAVITICGTC
ncbi:hypothetical protein NIES2135_54420 [Leptolyngbya boryana NIES-2135]|jgi:hypothetical protein|uniref:Uncharacterized protein n=1 Tax=Leptolyngbya boryana NIES-2135 TaxID=1973484 RepID=A0A1Z4JPB6_LEPBY|nr:MULTISPECIES: hypothetical protein [Leptolyngbya]BAY58569.1 hypothetical protein NIES2135_54420 [Leptolyngbya boryana NIES-2135]MBD2370755.1 hypothetical protein [Leptolyngbya sp. FACHB-161]MBD2377092.1 hypothetical protein [Leptolyngbya sp. FACHB-238]MBD2401535.1 hypothetical protein [Leptolyngbya sp. FACHB-239]MBD2408087.1 hypothetical protein [Leptolyngbya sp. FACHB-402]